MKKVTEPKMFILPQTALNYLCKRMDCMWHDKQNSVYYAAPFDYYCTKHLGVPFEQAKEQAVQDMAECLVAMNSALTGAHKYMDINNVAKDYVNISIAKAQNHGHI